MRRTRGQATLELALGGVLIVGTVMLALWLTEVSFLTVKVQEANAAALWDATGRTVDDYRVANNASANANYAQALAGVKATIGARHKVDTVRVFTQGKRLAIDCAPLPAGTLAYDVPATTAAVPSSVNAQLRQWYQPRGATMCRASADATAWQLPKTFADQSEGGFFSKYRDDRTFKLCGAGKAVGTTCPAGYPILLGDWALDGRAGSPITKDAVLVESVGVGLNDVNRPYRDMAQALFEVSGARYDANRPGHGPSGTFAARLGGQRPPGARDGHSDRKFYLSYAGPEHDYSDMLEWEPSGTAPACRQCHFNTAGTQPVHGNPKLRARDDWRLRRAPCFLGLGDCR